MAELINEIISPEAFKQVADMKAELASLTKQMEDMLKVLNSPSSPTGKPPLKDLPKQLKENEEALKQLRVIQNQIVTTNAKLAATETQYGEELAKSRLQLQQYNAELKQNAKEQQMASGSLDQMRANLNKLEKLYSAMSAEMRNAKVGQTIFADMVKAKEGVTLLEQSMGNYKRNVGNYTNSTFQLTQVLRELPSFTYSAQTGLMGISNNLPMLADAFQKVKQETGSTAGALKVFGASLFSFNNIFAVAIGLSTIFLPKLIEWASGTKEVDEATKKLAESIGKETAKFEALTRGLNDVTLSEKERLNIATELKDMYPKILANYTAEEIAAGKAAKAINQIKDALIGVAMARAAEEDLAKLAQQRYENEKKIADEKVKLANADAAAIRLTAASENARGNAQDRTIKAAIAQQKASEDAKNTIEELTKANADLDAQMSKVANSINKYRPAIQSIADATGTSPKSAQGKPTKRDKEDMMELPIIPAFKFTKMDKPKIGDNGIDEVMNRMQQQISKTPVTITIDFTAKEKLAIFAQKAVPILEQINQITQQSTQALGDLSASLTARKMQDLDMEQKKIQEKFDAEKNAIDQLSISQEEKTKRITALEAQRAAQQKRIDAERLQAARKQAAIDKGINIMNIITATALAVMKAIATPPVPNVTAGIIAGAIGAAQLAAAIAAPLPQFAKGTDNAPEGFAVVGERGTELVVNPDGTSWLTPAKDTITYLKKGAKVVPNNELMDMVKYANYVNVGGIKQGETGGLFGMALVSKFDELADKVDGLTRIMAGKNMSVNIQGNYDHYLHVRKNIR